MPAAASRKSSFSAPRHFAIVGAGMAGVACARTLVQAGHQVTVFEAEPGAGGRMASESTAFGRFDSGAQYFTVRDERFALALQTATKICRPWSANLVRVLDPHGRVAEAALPSLEPHYVAQPGMDALVAHWAQPLGERLVTNAQVVQIEPDALDRSRWQVRTDGSNAAPVYSGFDAVLLAVPPARARLLLARSKASASLERSIAKVQASPCWTLMIAFPQANQPTLSHLGPQWNAARSTHHRVAWLARESSKPGREPVERWTLQASPTWSQEHLRDDAPRVEAKLLRAFSEITGIYATPNYARARCWPEAQTQAPLGKPHEDAFLSGLSLALAVA
ncbi:MAG: FAD-dependent oxidoreductase [Variovorax sp.]|nr:MAG: FAD-dependent oxidoreductase [Variovorax sp.]